ncbi:hypothetical protein TNCV_2403661 [Trichonephila clavipes]|uniref:Uncharacterized protein n=1 Tax=Trichonephila clavipes TaxID=2585209 RepID=A0A8X6R934_TRICX|nr:hypothetical protein TNCV_2403661 [Trichonephila clavipes]
MTEEKLSEHIMRLAPQVIDYVESPINNVVKEDWGSRTLPDWRRCGNWRDAAIVNMQNDARVMNVDSNGFRYRGGARNQGFENTIRNDRGGQRSDSRRGRNDLVNRGSSNVWIKEDRKALNNVNCLSGRYDQSQIKINHPSRMATLRLSPVDLPYVPTLLHETFIKA